MGVISRKQKEIYLKELETELDVEIDELKMRLYEVVSVAEEEEIYHRIEVLQNRKNTYYNLAHDLD